MAAALSVSTEVPSGIAFAMPASYQRPMTGSTKPALSMPAPPMIARPRAPVFGKRSFTKPSIVGQKKQTPNAKTVADAKRTGPLETLMRARPTALRTELPRSMPSGCSRWTNGPANCRPTAIRPVIQTRTRMPETPAFSRIDGIHWPGPSSVAAVISMQRTITRKRGFRHAANIAPVETPISTRSVRGRRWPRKSAPYAASGRSMVANCAFHPRPAWPRPNPTRPPMTMPPGNHTWNWFSFVVLSFG